VNFSYYMTTLLFKLIEIGFTNDDFTFFLKKRRKETGRLEDDFTCNVVLHPDDLSLIYKKKIQRTHFYKLKWKKTFKYKNANNWY